MSGRETQISLERAEHLLRRGRFESAKGLFGMVLGDDPRCLRAHLGAADAAVGLQEPDKAARRLVEVASWMEEEGFAAEARRLRAKAIAIAPAQVEYQVEQATVAIRAGRFADAVVVLTGVADQHLARGEYELARDILARVERLEAAKLGRTSSHPRFGAGRPQYREPCLTPPYAMAYGLPTPAVGVEFDLDSDDTLSGLPLIERPIGR